MAGASIFDYCERGMNPDFWAEPLNALTNAGFIAAALAGAVMIGGRASFERSIWSIFFVLNLIAIGIGSFLFHTMPNATTALADAGPIGLFMLAYLIFALRNLVKANWLVTAAAMALFIGAMIVTFNVRCWDGRVGFALDIPAGAQAKCLNGSLGYGPALLAMGLIAAWLAFRRHWAASLMTGAALTFSLSLTLRSLDRTLCSSVTLLGYAAGTHFLWHLLNALTLFMLLIAAIRSGSRTKQTIMPPRPKPGPSTYTG